MGEGRPASTADATAVPDQPVEFANWLEGRFEVDAAARSATVEAAALADVGGRRPVRLVDLGSGLGANTRYYAPLIGGDQRWTLYEYDPDLAARCPASLAAWAARQGWPVRATGPSRLHVDLDGASIDIDVVNGPVERLEPGAEPIDLVVANALFDLFTADQFRRLADRLAVGQVPLLATLNYTSMVFEPRRADDAHFVELYERHMVRPRQGGPSMGPGCADVMQAVLEDLGFGVVRDRSAWALSDAHRPLIAATLAFMAGSVPEVAAGPADRARFADWLDGRRQALEDGRLALSVEHADLYATVTPARSG